jgi:hypothetical protein
VKCLTLPTNGCEGWARRGKASVYWVLAQRFARIVLITYIPTQYYHCRLFAPATGNFFGTGCLGVESVDLVTCFFRDGLIAEYKP